MGRTEESGLLLVAARPDVPGGADGLDRAGDDL
jgi:hypothetical protein